jgi:hypothetical protein
VSQVKDKAKQAPKRSEHRPGPAAVSRPAPQPVRRLDPRPAAQKAYEGDDEFSCCDIPKPKRPVIAATELPAATRVAQKADVEQREGRSLWYAVHRFITGET